MPDVDADPAVLSIACFIHSLAGGGAERVMAGLASSLAQRGHHVTLVTFENDADDRHDVDEAVNRVSLDLSRGARGLMARVSQVRRRHRAIDKSITELSPDVILSFCDRTNVDVLLAAHRHSPPIIVSERSDPARQSLGLVRNAVRKRVYRRAACVIALTQASANYLRLFCDRVTVIPSAIKPPLVSPDRSVAQDCKTIVAAGRLESEKGFDRLLSAFAQSTAGNPDWRLIIFGEGSQRKSLARQAESLGIKDRFELPGWVRPLSDPLSKATLFCLSSRYEGFPSVLLEAMSMGVPVVSVDCESGPRVIIDHGRNGLLVEPSIEGLVEGLSRMINNADHREKLGRAGQSVINEFGWEPMVDQYETTLRNAAPPPKKVSGTFLGD